jgi:hypothetical protein
MTLMTVSAAAAQLENSLRSHPWYHSIADGHSELGSTIFLCVKSNHHAPLRELDGGYLGFSVQIRVLTPPRFTCHGDLVFVGVPDEDDNEPSHPQRFARAGETRRPWESRAPRDNRGHRPTAAPRRPYETESKQGRAAVTR